MTYDHEAAGRWAEMYVEKCRAREAADENKKREHAERAAELESQLKETK